MAIKNFELSYLATHDNSSKNISKDINEKVQAFKASHPQQKIYMMGVGDTSQPLSPTVVQALVDSANSLGNKETYTGYEDLHGHPQLRNSICYNYYQSLGISLDVSEVFVIDGAQSALGNIQDLFSSDNIVAIQNPTYPYFAEGNFLLGRDRVIYLDCHEKNGFLPKPPDEKVDLIYLCFPNNPTGSVATFQTLKAFVDAAISYHCVIIFDAVYSQFVKTPNIPRSIYEIEGAQECAIEINSFSKMANFTGLRLGWCVVPHTLVVGNSTLGELNQMWKTRYYTKFWGASNLAQKAGIAALSEQGQKECRGIVDYYLRNASILREGLSARGLTCFGGIDNPYIWVKTPQGISSWHFFNQLLQETGIVGMPGCFFGSCGEGYLRLSTMGHREEIEESLVSLASLKLETM